MLIFYSCVADIFFIVFASRRRGALKKTQSLLSLSALKMYAYVAFRSIVGSRGRHPIAACRLWTRTVTHPNATMLLSFFLLSLPLYACSRGRRLMDGSPTSFFSSSKSLFCCCSFVSLVHVISSPNDKC
jgi:hypothetical protein